MFGKIKEALARLAGGGGGEPEPAADVPAVEYKGYRLKPTPYRNGNVFQTAGTIEKDFPDGVKEHRFVRADTCASEADARNLMVQKAQRLIDEVGDRLFG